MKYKFSFLQIANWVYTCKEDLKKILKLVQKNNYNKEDLIKKLELQKKQIIILRDILKRETKLQGIQKDFLTNLSKIKSTHGLE